MAKDEVAVLDFWVSPFAMRVKIALAEKGVEFVSKHEDDLLGNKSELLLESNPVYEKVPVLLHDGHSVCESLVVLNYIDEAWPTPALLPKCPYERSTARFWADVVDKKLYKAGDKIWKSKGEEAQEAAKEEFIQVVKLLEGALGDDEYFGGKEFGFLDIAVVPLTWFYAYEQFGGFKLVDECPKFVAWIGRCLERESVAKVLPDPAKVFEFVCMARKMFGVE